MSKYSYEAFRYAIIVCRDPFGRFLCVKESENKGWWLPGGKVTLQQTFMQAAIRQCVEETHITPQLQGIIRIDYGKFYTQNCLRCIYYAEQQNIHEKVKRVKDDHTEKAQFLTIDEILNLKNEWRSSEIYEFPKYVSEGGNIHPLSVFAQNFTRLNLAN